MNRNAETAEPSPELSARRVVWLTIPCFNDADRLGRYLPELCSKLAPLPVRVWVQVVDDGSRQENRQALESLVDRIRAGCPMVRPALCLEHNEGKGGAILSGWDAALENGIPDDAWVGFLDADGAVPAREVARILAGLAAAPNAQRSLFAARIQMRGRTVKRRLKRHLMGRVFATIVGTMIDPGIYDSQCGFKLVPAAAYRRIRPVLEEKRFAFDVELLAALNHFGFAVEEIPVDWEDVPGSKVSPLRDAWRMFRSVRAIRRRLPAPPGFKSLLANVQDRR